MTSRRSTCNLPLRPRSPRSRGGRSPGARPSRSRTQHQPRVGPVLRHGRGRRPPAARRAPENPVPLGLELPPPPVDPFAGFPDETPAGPPETEQPKTNRRSDPAAGGGPRRPTRALRPAQASPPTQALRLATVLPPKRALTPWPPWPPRPPRPPWPPWPPWRPRPPWPPWPAPPLSRPGRSSTGPPTCRHHHRVGPIRGRRPHQGCWRTTDRCPGQIRTLRRPGTTPAVAGATSGLSRSTVMVLAVVLAGRARRGRVCPHQEDQPDHHHHAQPWCRVRQPPTWRWPRR